MSRYLSTRYSMTWFFYSCTVCPTYSITLHRGIEKIQIWFQSEWQYFYESIWWRGLTEKSTLLNLSKAKAIVHMLLFNWDSLYLWSTEPALKCHPRVEAGKNTILLNIVFPSLSIYIKYRNHLHKAMQSSEPLIFIQVWKENTVYTFFY